MSLSSSFLYVLFACTAQNYWSLKYLARTRKNTRDMALLLKFGLCGSARARKNPQR
jgi:hypothetical protein